MSINKNCCVFGRPADVLGEDRSDASAGRKTARGLFQGIGDEGEERRRVPQRLEGRRRRHTKLRAHRLDHAVADREAHLEHKSGFAALNKLEAASFVGKRSLTGNLSRFLDNQRRYGRHAAWGEKRRPGGRRRRPASALITNLPRCSRRRPWTRPVRASPSRCARSPACATMDASTTGEPDGAHP